MKARPWMHGMAWLCSTMRSSLVSISLWITCEIDLRCSGVCGKLRVCVGNTDCSTGNSSPVSSPWPWVCPPGTHNSTLVKLLLPQVGERRWKLLPKSLPESRHCYSPSLVPCPTQRFSLSRHHADLLSGTTLWGAASAGVSGIINTAKWAERQVDKFFEKDAIRLLLASGLSTERECIT